MRFVNNKLTLAFLLIFFSLIFMTGCGGKEETSNPGKCNEAPFGSKITIDPSEQPYTVGTALAFDLFLDWHVTVTYPDETPMPGACLNINGPLATPNGYAAYTFVTYQAHLPLASGFSAATNNYGNYTFTTLITAGTSTFSDTISVTSGANTPGTAKIEIN